MIGIELLSMGNTAKLPIPGPTRCLKGKNDLFCSLFHTYPSLLCPDTSMGTSCREVQGYLEINLSGWP